MLSINQHQPNKRYVTEPETWPKLKASKLIIVVRGGQVETFKLNMQNHDIIELMDTIGLRKMAARKGTPRVTA